MLVLIAIIVFLVSLALGIYDEVGKRGDKEEDKERERKLKHLFYLRKKYNKLIKRHQQFQKGASSKFRLYYIGGRILFATVPSVIIGILTFSMAPFLNPTYSISLLMSFATALGIIVGIVGLVPLFTKSAKNVPTLLRGYKGYLEEKVYGKRLGDKSAQRLNIAMKKVELEIESLWKEGRYEERFDLAN
ncbi:MAG: hypothetical protein MI810_01960 [Flavobacteriales bacterium]|nr:hypothetical protein [Flavobacteriales bacterium]